MKLGSKSKRQRQLLIRIGIFSLSIIILLLIVSAVKRYQIERDMAGRREVLETEKAELLERKQSLEAKVEYLQDERSLEAEIRRSFDVAREGEQVVVILDAPEVTVVATGTAEVEAVPWYIFWR